MPEFNPFGQLMEVRRYKENLAMKQDQIARQNAIQMGQLHQQARKQSNAMYQADQTREAAQRRQMGLEMTLGNVPEDRRREELINRGYLKEAGQLTKAMGGADSTSPSNVREWEFYNNLPDADKPKFLAMKRAGKSINLGSEYIIPSQVDPSRPPIARFQKDLAPKDTPAVKAAQTGAVKEAERVAKVKALKPKAEASLKAFERSSDNIMKTIDEAIAGASGKTAGFFGQKTAGIAGTDAFTLAEQLKTIKSSDAFGFLQEMRNNSPTGGAVGQLSDRELEVMGLLKASINQGLDPIKLKSNLKRIKKLTAEIRKDARTAYTKDFLQEVMPPKPITVGKFIVEAE